MPTLTCKMKSYIQPFERKLALKEIQVICNGKPELIEDEAGELYFQVTGDLRAERVAKKLAYWESIKTDKTYFTDQVLREATTNVVRNGVDIGELKKILPFSTDIPLPNRRCLRYGPHGIHEYRGKFFPQLVKSLINDADIPQNGIVVDPMCGSGTTLVEALLGGHRTYGLDINPLSAFMSSSKCELLEVKPNSLAREYRKVRETLLDRAVLRANNQRRYFGSLAAEDQRYLSSWFAEDAINDLDLVIEALNRVKNEKIRKFFYVSLSNILRKVSWQKIDDLRVRKEVRLDCDVDAVKEFLEELGKSVRLVLAFLYQEGNKNLPRHSISQGDARNASQVWNISGEVDTIITSPPYATALPYLDTDRLSLSYLNLLSRPNHRKTDWKMIGNREISEKQRRELWDLFLGGKMTLPNSITRLVKKIDLLNQNTDAGFRRKNLPSLLVKYFDDMTGVLASCRKLLKPGAKAYFVVGNNHTIAGGERVEIETGKLLCDIGESVGLQIDNVIPMEMLVSRDIFRKNASDTEKIICFRRP